MPRTSETNEPPLYVRWTPDESPVAIELRLDLVPRIREHIVRAEKSNIEIGGIFVGTTPQRPTPTIRVEDVVVIPRQPEDGPIFMLDPREHDRFLTTRWDAKTGGRSAVGFFRTHWRPGPLRPSLADRTILGGQFSVSNYLALLIEGREPYRSALFVGSRNRLAEEPSVPEFHFQETEFASLPQDEAPGAAAPARSSMGPRRIFWAVLLAIAAAIVVILWRMSYFGQTLTASDQGLGLQVNGGPILTITWNHSSSDLAKAVAAKLVIEDGKGSREVPIGGDELRLGTMEYRHVSDEVKITFVVNMPGSITISQSVDWRGAGS